MQIADVLGKQVLMFDEKKKLRISLYVQSLSHCCAHAPGPGKCFTPPSLRTSAPKSKRSQGLGRF